MSIVNIISGKVIGANSVTNIVVIEIGVLVFIETSISLANARMYVIIMYVIMIYPSVCLSH